MAKRKKTTPSKRGEKSKRKPRSKRPKKEKTPAVTIDTVEDTTGDRGEGAVDLQQPRLVSKIKDAEDYIRADAFTPEETRAMLRKMGSIVATDKTGRYAIPAYRVILARAKLAHDIERQREPAVTINTDGGGVDVFAVAESLGLSLDIRDDGEAEGRADVIEGSARRPQSKD